MRTIIAGDRHLPHTREAPNGWARRLLRSPLFRNVAVAQVKAVLQDASTRRVNRGGFYFRQDDRAKEGYVLMRGRLKLVRAGLGARRDILRFVSPLEPFGHEAALGGTRYAASAQASEDSEALAWPAAVLSGIMASHPAIAHNSLRVMAERIQAAWERFHGLLAEPLERRTARALLLLGARIGRVVEGGTAIELRLPRQDLAAFVGATPYAMSRIISRWRRLRIVDAGRGWVMIRPGRLAAMMRDRGLPRGRR